MRSLLLAFLAVCPFLSFAGSETDPVYLKEKRVMGLGFSIGASEQIDKATSFYLFTGKEWGVSRKVKFAAVADICKFAWAEQTNGSTTKNRYDRARYFAFSNRVNFCAGKYIFRTQPGQPDIYNKYLEFGVGYNLPLYCGWKEVYGSEKVNVNYPNNHNDLYAFTKFFFVDAYIPFAVTVEYHPMDVIANRYLPDIPKLNFAIEIPIYYRSEKLLTPQPAF